MTATSTKATAAVGHSALATYRAGQAMHAAIVLGEQVYDLRAAWRLSGGQMPAPPWVNGDVAGILADWAQLEAPWHEFALRAEQARSAGRLDPASRDARALAAPFVPARIFCAASNYVEHANEMGTALAAKSASRPYMFLKTGSSVIGPDETVRIPSETTMPDWEVELGAVIGRRARRVAAEHALDYVAGYVIVNDVSARDLNRRSDYPFKHDWFQGKNHDTFCPLGPWIVPARAIADPQRLWLRLSVNGAPMQDGTTADMIWTVREQIAYLSTIVTLMPGDVVATGTPSGVGMGRGTYLKPGDVMLASVEQLGELRNPVAAEVT
jgi:2-keto-4-pentenoate hydratase/2-oxohepta-3-ene-1,7-dioic acid hydratase in catechol pathway